MLLINGVPYSPEPFTEPGTQEPDLETMGGPESQYGPFVASTFGRKFHRPTCQWMTYVRRVNIIRFDSHEEAVRVLKPCGTCRA